MGFNVPGWGFIAAGSTISVGYQWGAGDDHGAQFAQGKPENPLGDLISDQEEIFRSEDGHIFYSFRLQNIGQNTTFMLCGGGLG